MIQLFCVVNDDNELRCTINGQTAWLAPGAVFLVTGQAGRTLTILTSEGLGTTNTSYYYCRVFKPLSI